MAAKVEKVLGKKYLVAFCKGCGAGFRVRQEPLFEGKAVEIRQPETHRCPGCGNSSEYQPREIRAAKYQKQGLGRQKRSPQ